MWTVIKKIQFHFMESIDYKLLIADKLGKPVF